MSIKVAKFATYLWLVYVQKEASMMSLTGQGCARGERRHLAQLAAFTRSLPVQDSTRPEDSVLCCKWSQCPMKGRVPEAHLTLPHPPRETLKSAKTSLSIQVCILSPTVWKRNDTWRRHADLFLSSPAFGRRHDIWRQHADLSPLPPPPHRSSQARPLSAYAPTTNRFGSNARRSTRVDFPSTMSSDSAAPVAGAFRMPQQLCPVAT